MTKADFNNKLTSFNRKLPQIKRNIEKIIIQEKLNNLRKDYNFLLGKICFASNDELQNTFVYQPTLDTLELKKEKGPGNILSWKSNGVYNSKFKPLYTAFLHSINISGYKMGIKFDNDPLAEEQNNYLTKIVNLYIVYDLAAWSRNPTNNLKLMICLFAATNVVKNSDKEKYVYIGYGVAFNTMDSSSFDNDTARNVIIFHFNIISSSHDDNGKITF